MEDGGRQDSGLTDETLGRQGAIGEGRQRCLHGTCNQKSVPHPLFMVFLKHSK